MFETNFKKSFGDLKINFKMSETNNDKEYIFKFYLIFKDNLFKKKD